MSESKNQFAGTLLLLLTVAAIVGAVLISSIYASTSFTTTGSPGLINEPTTKPRALRKSASSLPTCSRVARGKKRGFDFATKS